MRLRPCSWVTTIFANLVGRSLVSAITQTPACGPLGPVTRPPISLSPTLESCCANPGNDQTTSSNNDAYKRIFTDASPQDDCTAVYVDAPLDGHYRCSNI